MASNVSLVPVPQADDLEKVVATVEAVDAGHHTGPEIASALGVVERQGFYYVAAAEQLGLVMHVTKDDIHLTPKGMVLASLDPAARKRPLRQAFCEMDVVKHLAHNLGIGKPTWAQHHLFTDRKYVSDTLEEAGLAPETAYRRSGTINSWIKALE